MKNLYIINEVLYDYSTGIVIIIATNLDECRSLFTEKFRVMDDHIEKLPLVWWQDFTGCIAEYDKAIELKKYKVIPVNDNEESRIVDFLYGGS